MGGDYHQQPGMQRSGRTAAREAGCNRSPFPIYSTTMEKHSARAELLAYVARRCAAFEADRVIVAIDGVDGSGKTTFADELAAMIMAFGRIPVRAGIDGFHHPRELRYRRGKDSPEGFFLDSYNYEALSRSLLLPFRSGARIVRTACFDHRSNREVESFHADLAERSILLIDGIFLHRDELTGCWDLSCFLDVPFTVSYMRMAVRDGSNADHQAPENRRYLEGQQIYLKQCSPGERATFLIDNADLNAPRLLRERPPGPHP